MSIFFSIFLFFFLCTGLTSCNHPIQDTLSIDAVYLSKEEIVKLTQQKFKKHNALQQNAIKEKYLSEKEINASIQQKFKKHNALQQNAIKEKYLSEKEIKEMLDKNISDPIDQIFATYLTQKTINEELDQLKNEIMNDIQFKHENFIKNTDMQKLNETVENNKKKLENQTEKIQYVYTIITIQKELEKLELNYYNEAESKIKKPENCLEFIKNQMTLKITYLKEDYIIYTWNFDKKEEAQEWKGNFEGLIALITINVANNLDILKYDNINIQNEIKNLLENIEIVTCQEQITNLKKYWDIMLYQYTN